MGLTSYHNKFRGNGCVYVVIGDFLDVKGVWFYGGVYENMVV